MKKIWRDLPIFWKITIGSVIIFSTFILFMTMTQALVFFEWFFDHKKKYGIDLKIFKDIFESYGWLVFASIIVAFLISLAGGMLISNMFLSKIRNLTNTIENIKNEGDLQKRVEFIDNNDEISKLCFVFNSLMDDVEKSFDREKRFVQDASHELKTPLTIIKGHLSLIDRWGKNDKEVLDKSIKISREEVDRLIVLVKSLLDLSSLENDKEIIRGKCNIKDAAKNLLEEFSIIDNNINIRFNDNNIKEFYMNEEHLKQVLIILIDNAIKYSKDKKEIDISIREDETIQILSVKDNGIGIPKEDLSLLFDRFYRVDKSRNSKSGGNGLGLSIAMKLTKLYGGYIDVESKENEGSIFSVKIPKSL